MTKKKSTKKAAKKATKKTAAAEVILENQIETEVTGDINGDISQYLVPGLHIIPGELIPKLVDNTQYQPRLTTVIDDKFRDEIAAVGGNYYDVLMRPEGETLETVDGRRRVLACAALQLPLNIKVVEMSRDEAWLKSIASFNKEDLTFVERMLAYTRSIEDHGMKLAEIALKFGKDETHCSVLLNIVETFPGETSKIQDFLDAGILYSDFRAVVSLENSTLIEQFLSLKIDNSLTSKELGKFVKLQKDVDYLVELLGPEIKNRIHEQELLKNVDVPKIYSHLNDLHERRPTFEQIQKLYARNIQKVHEENGVDISHLLRLNELSVENISGLRHSYEFIVEHWEAEKPNYEFRKELYELLAEEYSVSRNSDYDIELVRLRDVVFSMEDMDALGKLSAEFLKLQKKYQEIDAAKQEAALEKLREESEKVNDESLSFNGTQSEVIADLVEKKEAVINVIAAELSSESDEVESLEPVSCIVCLKEILDDVPSDILIGSDCIKSTTFRLIEGDLSDSPYLEEIKEAVEFWRQEDPSLFKKSSFLETSPVTEEDVKTETEEVVEGLPQPITETDELVDEDGDFLDDFEADFPRLENDIQTRFGNYHSKKELRIRVDHLHEVDFSTLVKDLDVVERIYSQSIYQKAKSVVEYILANKESVGLSYRELAYSSLKYYKTKKRLGKLSNSGYPSSKSGAFGSSFLVAKTGIVSGIESVSTNYPPRIQHATNLIHSLIICPQGTEEVTSKYSSKPITQASGYGVVLEPRIVDVYNDNDQYSSIKDVLISKPTQEVLSDE